VEAIFATGMGMATAVDYASAKKTTNLTFSKIASASSWV
jgi:hypothetical protein